MKRGLFRNLRLQTYLQILNTIIPLITTPYVARKIGAEGLGVFSYATSVAAYFTLFAMLGTLNYGVRSIAAVKDDMQSRSRCFWEIYSLQIITVILATIAYGILLMFHAGNRVMMVLQLITLIGYLFDITWFFQGIEEFEITVSVSMIVRLLTLASIFTFVRSESDLVVYTVIMLGSAALWQICLWFFVRGRLVFVSVGLKDIAKHVRPNIILFIPLIAMTVFHYMDKTMLGLLSSYEQTGFYYNVDKIITIPLGIFTGIGTVMLPKMTYLYLEDKGKADWLFRRSLEGVLLIAVAMSFGIYAVADDFVPVFLGQEYTECIGLVKVIAPVLAVKGLSNAIRVHYLIPAEKEKIYIWSVLIGAVVNIVCNYLMIPLFGALGAEIATILAEGVVLLIELAFILRIVSVSGMIKKCCMYVFIGGVMTLCIKKIGSFVPGIYARLCIMIMSGVLIFSIVTLIIWHLTKNELYKELTDRIRRR